MKVRQMKFTRDYLIRDWIPTKKTENRQQTNKKHESDDRKNDDVDVTMTGRKNRVTNK